MIEPVKVSAPMARPIDISTRLAPWMCARLADAEGGRRVERGRGDEDRGEADERMEGGDELRHRRHRDAPGDHGADAAADGDAEHDQQEAAPARRGESSVVTMAIAMPAMPNWLPGASFPGSTGRGARG